MNKIAFISSYKPRKCGIAMFAGDLIQSISSIAPSLSCIVVALNDNSVGYRYSREVKFEIKQDILSHYTDAAQFLNSSQINAVCLQHEYGLFGGDDGINIIELIKKVSMPVVTTLHTVLSRPSPGEKKVIVELADYSKKLIVISPKAKTILGEVYNISKEKIAHIPHGIPDVPFVNSEYYKTRLGLQNKKVLMTFGLLAPQKGIEYVIQALPEIISVHPDVVYVVLGETHPNVKREDNEDYRDELKKIVHDLDINEYVIFHNYFPELKDLRKFLGATDIYITPYLHEEQMSSGTLAYAMGYGKAVLSTPYWYALDMLGEDKGCIVPFRDYKAIAAQVIDLFNNDSERQALCRRSYMFCRNMVWRDVAKQYLNLFQEVGGNCFIDRSKTSNK